MQPYPEFQILEQIGHSIKFRLLLWQTVEDFQERKDEWEGQRTCEVDLEDY